MYKYLILIISLLFLSGCNIVDSDTHDKYNKTPKANIVIDTEDITSAGSSKQLTIHVLEDGSPVDDADITLSIWAAKEAEVWNEKYEVSHLSNGEYTAELNIPRDGLYLIKAHVSSDNIDAVPTKYFTVGELDMFEEVFLQEFSNDDSIEMNSHH